ncbi:YfiR family protein [uncultured Methylophaga sp.]|uniref:YfiR family protein n=1 Tax=uncultured Methylophaga sp. TaxID=285271 RepID=UPI0026191E37|nr:YfiR family protein [uncultured Methylophaga sp.]
MAVAEAPDSRSLIAALNYNFAKYAHWPRDEEQQSIHLCFFTERFKQSFAGLQDKAIFNKPVKVRQLSQIEQSRDCHLVYIDRSERSLLRRLFLFLQDKPVLTVSDITGFSDEGGMIEIFRVNNKFRFKVNQSRIESARLKMSSQVLKLAVEVK